MWVNMMCVNMLVTLRQVGDGVSQDFHLAKRYYDQAAEVDTKARVPRDIALLVLEVTHHYNCF